MLDDCEPPYHSGPTHELPSKVIGHIDNHLMIDVSKVDNETVGEGEHGITTPIEKKCCEATDPSQHKDGGGPHDFEDMEESISGNKNEDENMVALHSIPTAKMELVEKETGLYTDKIVTEIELPEMIVCFKGGAYHIIKDICIDEGVHSVEKFLVKNDEVDLKNFYCFNHSAADGRSDLTKEMRDNAVPILDDLKSSVVNGHLISSLDKDVGKQCSSESLLEGGGNLERVNQTENNLSAENIMGKQLLPLQDFDKSHTDSSSSDCSNDQKQSINGINDQREIDQVALEEVNSTEAAVTYAAKDSNQSNGTKESPSSHDLESGTITFDFDVGSTSISGKAESKDNPDSSQCGQALNSSILEEVTFDGPATSARSSFVHHSHEASSFSGPVSLSGPIVHSGRIPYSGNISLRSDSSTTSARSFAFPVLQSEWNSSPIKMVKADRRHLRKHRGWRMGLLCCRF